MDYISNFSASQIANPILMSVLRTKGIPYDVWKNSDLKECNYFTERKGFFGFCWQNDSGGFAIQDTRKYKTFFGDADITTVSTNGPDLFLFDSYLTYLKAKSEFHLNGAIIILNYAKFFYKAKVKNMLKKKNRVFIKFSEFDPRFKAIIPEIQKIIPGVAEF